MTGTGRPGVSPIWVSSLTWLRTGARVAELVSVSRSRSGGRGLVLDGTSRGFVARPCFDGLGGSEG
jgi:hypothetical protein